jgi:hypothetical protein
MSHFGQLNNPHPMSRCPLCSATKPVVSWRACSFGCDELMRVVPKAIWALPTAPVGPDPVMAISWQPRLRS